jgi:RND family efflux transporter MFP subunit
MVSFAMLAACGGEPPEQEVIRPVLAVKVGDVAQLRARWFPGRAKAHNELDLSFRVEGPLIVLPNDVVGRDYKEDQVIARIDPRDYEVKERDVAAQLERARASYRRAKSDYERELRIFKKDPGATSQASVDRKLAQRDQALAQVNSLEASLEAAQDNLSYTYLKAPFDGKVVAKYVDNFQDVRPKQPVARLLDASRIEMVVGIPETLIVNLPYVEQVEVVFDAFPDRPIPAEIFEVGTEASATTRTYPITLIMDQPEDIEILAGMAGKARAVAKSPQAAASKGLEVPVGAVFTPDTERRDHVWVVKTDDGRMGTLELRPVATGKLTSRGVVIREGLEPDEWVLIAGVHSVRGGQKVRILEAPQGG